MVIEEVVHTEVIEVVNMETLIVEVIEAHMEGVAVAAIMIAEEVMAAAAATTTDVEVAEEEVEVMAVMDMGTVVVIEAIQTLEADLGETRIVNPRQKNSVSRIRV